MTAFTTGAERLEHSLRTPRHPGRPALMPYLVAGYPDREHFASLLHRVSTVADAIELGVPFTDPMADGVSIQAAAHASLQQGTNLAWILQTLTDMDPAPEAPVLLMSYLNPLLSYGIRELMTDAEQAGVCGFIIPDLPWEESEEIRGQAAQVGIALVQLVTPVTPPDRLARLAAASRGFVYAVTMTGTTGGDALPADLAAYLGRIKAATDVPVCAGFGIRRPEQVASLAGHADGVIVGSALVDVLRKGEDPVAFLEGLVQG